MAVKCDKSIQGWQGDDLGNVGAIPTAVSAQHWQGDAWEDALLSWGG